MPPHINIKELYSIQKKKEEQRHVSYDHILNLIHRRIKVIANHGGTNTFYEIPGLVVGYPLFDLYKCTKYIMNALRDNSFFVQILPPPHIAVIYVSWDKQDTKMSLPAPVLTRERIELPNLKTQIKKQLRLF